MNALEALGYMGVEIGRIIQVRNVKLGIVVVYDDLMEGRYGLVLCSADIVNDEWELGWRCTKCEGSGQITVPCPRCSGRSLHLLLENPCCGGWDEADCRDCDNGIKWETEY